MLMSAELPKVLVIVYTFDMKLESITKSKLLLLFSIDSRIKEVTRHSIAEYKVGLGTRIEKRLVF